MPNNSVVTILDTTNATWYKVNFNENIGYALAQYISTTSAVVAIIKLKAGYHAMLPGTKGVHRGDHIPPLSFVEEPWATLYFCIF